MFFHLAKEQRAQTSRKFNISEEEVVSKGAKVAVQIRIPEQEFDTLFVENLKLRFQWQQDGFFHQNEERSETGTLRNARQICLLSNFAKNVGGIFVEWIEVWRIFIVNFCLKFRESANLNSSWFIYDFGYFFFDQWNTFRFFFGWN